MNYGNTRRVRARISRSNAESQILSLLYSFRKLYNTENVIKIKTNLPDTVEVDVIVEREVFKVNGKKTKNIPEGRAGERI